jgi:hypothetical protein
MSPLRLKRRWYRLSLDRLIVGLMAVQAFLVLSQQFQWFAFNERKGWTVLIGCAVLGLDDENGYGGHRFDAELPAPEWLLNWIGAAGRRPNRRTR